MTKIIYRMKEIICTIFGHNYKSIERETFVLFPGSKTTNYKDKCKRCGKIDEGGYTEF